MEHGKSLLVGVTWWLLCVWLFYVKMGGGPRITCMACVMVSGIVSGSMGRGV